MLTLEKKKSTFPIVSKPVLLTLLTAVSLWKSVKFNSPTKVELLLVSG